MTTSRQSGFTLLELLLAIGLTALIAMASYGALDGVNRSRVAYEEKARQLAGLQRFFNRLGADLRQAADIASRGVDGEPEPAFALSGGAEIQLVFSRRGWHNPLLAARSELQRVYYRFDGERVSRGYWQSLYRVADTPVRERELLDGVSEMQVRVLPPGQTSNLERSWIADWPPGNELERLPVAVEITLEVPNLGRIRRIYELLPQS